MGKDLQKTIDKTQLTEEIVEQPEAKSSSGAFSDLNRKISEKALSNPDVGRLILDRNYQLEEELNECKQYKEKYHEADKRADVATETLKNLKGSIGSRNVMLLLGGIMAGYLPTAWNSQNIFVATLVISILLIIGGIFNVSEFIDIIKNRGKK